jgi:soluble lytic murein transglycosylase-like protein
MPVLPQYISQAVPTAGIIQDTVPNVQLTGVAQLTKSIQGALTGITNFRDELNTNNALKEYNEELIKMKQDLQMNSTIDNIDSRVTEFNTNANNLLGSTLAKHGVSMSKTTAITSEMLTKYGPSNLAYSLDIANSVKQKAFEDHELNYDNELGALFSSVSAAQLRGESGTALLEQQLARVDQEADLAIKSGMIPEMSKSTYATKKKMQVSNYFWGRFLKEDPQGAVNFATNNSRQVLLDQAEVFRSTASTGKYQSIYKVSDTNFTAYQQALNSLSETEKAKLGIAKITVDKQASTNSYLYDLGSLYKDSLNSGQDFKTLLKDKTILNKYSTPYSPYFTKDSKFYSEETKDFAGSFINGSFIPANLTPGSKYFNENMKFTSTSTLEAIQSAYGTYKNSAMKAKDESKQMTYAQKLYELSKRMQTDLYEGVPTNITYPSKSNYSGQDMYSNVPVPKAPVDKSLVIDTIKSEAKLLGIPEAYALALFEKESGFRSTARGAAGEYGLGQLMPSTAQGMGVKNPWDIQENIRAALKYYNIGYKKYKDPELAYARYNGGPGNLEHYRLGHANAGYKGNVKGYMKLVRKYDRG